MKAVVATSRMHEGSRRRTDSCEIPSSGTSRQSSMQQDPPPESTSPAPTDKEALPPDQQPPREDESKPANQSAVSPSLPRSPKPPSSDVTPTGPAPTRPPAAGDGLRQASVIPKNHGSAPNAAEELLMVDPASRVRPHPSCRRLQVPAASATLHAGAEPASKTLMPVIT
ncbi:hypothetical protein GBF38_018324 [Nibea albiflora]|uniref:Uncharacterized protein n=1 Tax=Nibea albiflora TaxID=240163 RepID=A0ACB7EM89_NIBAL|nr:hypothetical protein GBF38_018324 [Nibea albiflora]